MTISDFIKELREKYGLICGETTVDKIDFKEELRGACECNSCGNYGKNHMCPPLVGTPAEVIATAQKYKSVILFSGIYMLEDSYDFEGMMEGQREFKEKFSSVVDLAEKEFQNPLILGVGGCQICEKCAAIENKPCRFPHKAHASLESYCIQVSELASTCGMKYINGQNTATYFGGVFVAEK